MNELNFESSELQQEFDEAVKLAVDVQKYFSVSEKASANLQPCEQFFGHIASFITEIEVVWVEVERSLPQWQKFATAAGCGPAVADSRDEKTTGGQPMSTEHTQSAPLRPKRLLVWGDASKKSPAHLDDEKIVEKLEDKPVEPEENPEQNVEKSSGQYFRQDPEDNSSPPCVTTDLPEVSLLTGRQTVNDEVPEDTGCAAAAGGDALWQVAEAPEDTRSAAATAVPCENLGLRHMNQSEHLERSISASSPKETPRSCPDPPLQTLDESETKVVQVPRAAQGVSAPPVMLWCGMMKNSNLIPFGQPETQAKALASPASNNTAPSTIPNKVVHAGTVGKPQVLP